MILTFPCDFFPSNSGTTEMDIETIMTFYLDCFLHPHGYQMQRIALTTGKILKANLGRDEFGKMKKKTQEFGVHTSTRPPKAETHHQTQTQFVLSRVL